MEKMGNVSLLVEKNKELDYKTVYFWFPCVFCYRGQESYKKIWPGHLFSLKKVPIGSKEFGRVANLPGRNFPIGSVNMPGR